ncbi:MAG: protein-export chaperone SecB [Alphaproteobacteria bacterium]
MADESPKDTTGNKLAESGDAAAGADKSGQAAEAPPIVINGQYIKDFSFENPHAPESLMQAAQESPAISVTVDVGAKQVQERSYEIVLTIRTEAKREEKTMFLVELQYAGVFTLAEVPKEVVQALVFIEAPRLLFPFARHIIAECVRDGGFPPLMIQPIDFVALFKQRMAKQAQTGTNGAETKADGEDKETAATGGGDSATA